MIRAITKPELSGLYFAAILAVGYVAFPYFLNFYLKEDVYFIELAHIAIVSALCVLFAFKFDFFDKASLPEVMRLRVDVNRFCFVVWLGFGAFVILAWSTANDIPLVSAVRCQGAAELAHQRETFLKARAGWEASLVYINGIFVGAIVPYTIALMFLCRTKYRWLCLGLFFIYSVSFLEKALFLRAAIPLFYIVARRDDGRLIPGLGIVAGMAAGMYLITLVSTNLCGEAPGQVVRSPAQQAAPNVKTVRSEPWDPARYFAHGYIPKGPLDHVIWRSVAVPLFTAADSLAVFHEQFNGRPLLGATSTFVAGLLGETRVPFERIVFESQWGQNVTGTGSANSVFFTEAYVNFGWPGVIVFSLFVGGSLRWFARSKDEAFRSLWMLYCSGLYSAGLIGLLLSNGFMLVMLFSLFSKFEVGRAGAEPASA
ncbi:hypothetical protein KQX64_20960 [Rhodopseudomonas palustris]|nr:hypothetical protein KQX64_20960 [Rhodopseudomonas palustris]